MILCLIATALVLAIAYFQSRQGLFSSLIFAILTLLSATIAVHWYQPLSRWMLFDRHQLYADAICLVLLFAIPLYGLRCLLDWFISGNVVLNKWVDLAGGGVIGLLTAILHVGIFTLALQMLPLGPSILGYRAFDDQLRPTSGLWLFQPDRATLSLTTGLANGAMSTDTSFSLRHDNLLLELFCRNYRPEKSGFVREGRGKKEKVATRMGRLDSDPGDIKISTVLEVPREIVESWSPGSPHPLIAEALADGKWVVVVRTRVSMEAAERSGTKAVNWWMLPGPHFRLVSTEHKSYYPIGYLTHLALDSETAAQEASRRRWKRPHSWVFIGPSQQDQRDVFHIADVYVERLWDSKSEYLVVDWIYLLPPTAPDAPELPAYMVFRRGATAEVDVKKVLAGPEAKEAFPTLAPEALDRKLTLE